MTRGAVVTAVSLLTWWGLLFVLYLVCVSTVPPMEVVVGAAAALLGALAAEALRRAEHPRTRGVRGLVRAAVAFPPTLLRETGLLAAAVVRTLRGRAPEGELATIRLEPGASTALAAALLSASPGACVIDMTEDGRPGGGAELTVHLLGERASAVERALPGRRVP
ncbi:MAG TPA: Na+/H+ antiporter subunit E [Streptomyces sp.]